MQFGLLAFLVLSAAIISFFLDDFKSLFKKLFALPGVELLLPLIILSVLLVLYNDEVFNGLYSLQGLLRQGMLALMHARSFNLGVLITTSVMGIFLLTSLPGFGVYWLVKYMEWGNPAVWALRTSGILLIFWVFLWIS